MRVCPTHSALRNLSTWVINNLWRPLLIHRAGETALDMSFSEDLCSALPFIKRKQVQWRTVRELSVGSDHWHKQSKLTQPSYSTCHSGNTNRSIWGGARSLFKTHIRAPASSSRAPWCKKCVLNTYQSLWQEEMLIWGANVRQMRRVSRMPLVKTCHLNFQPYCAETNVLRNPLHCNLYHFNARFNSPLLREEVPGRVETH